MNVKDALSSAATKITVKHTGGGNTDGEAVTDNVVMDNSDGIMGSFFRVNPNELSQTKSNQLNYIYDWASDQTGDGDELDVLGVLKDLKFRLGSPRVGVNDIEHMYKYIKLRQSASNSINKAKAMEL